MSNRMPLKNAFDSTPSDETVERIWHHIQTSEADVRNKAKTIRRQWAAMAALIIAGVVVGAWLVGKMLTPNTESLTLMATSELPGTVRAAGFKSIRLSDGTQIQLQPEAAIEFVKNTHAEVEIAVRQGIVHFDIPPTKERAWTIHCGFAQVDVVGTIFDIVKDEAQVRISVQRGSVLVRGENVNGGVQRLRAGEQLSVFRLGPVSPPPNENESGRHSHPSPSVVTRSTDGDTQNYNLDNKQLEERDADINNRLNEPDGSVPLTIDELYVLADSDRLAGHTKEALMHLHRIVSDYPNHPRTAVAAFTIAKLYFEAFETPTRAAEYFEKALNMGLTDPLRETAMAKIAEAYYAANHPRYRAAAKKYLQIYPNGEYTDQINTLLSKRR